MLVKILARHTASYKNLITYILKEDKTKDKEQIIIKHNLRSDNINGYVKEYIQNEAIRSYPRSNNIYLYHEIISLSAKENNDAITKEMLTDLARQYISLRGDKGMYIGAVHYDKEHIHIHLCSSGVEYRTGKAFRLSKDHLHELKVQLQEYHKEKYPELSKSFCEHGKGREYTSNNEWYVQNRNERTLLKAEINEKVQNIYNKSTSQKDFLDKLRDEGLHHYDRSGKPSGIEYEDMKFRFSRLDVDMDKLEERNNDMNEEMDIEKTDEEMALDEIESIRNNSQDYDKDEIENDRDDDMDIDDDR